MANSQNGWPVVGQSAVTDRAVHGVEFPNGWLKGDVDVVFTYLIGRLHREVEPIDNGGCWGWFVKKIEGSATISNHASGTAIDYNAPAHPMGSRNTYNAAKRAKIRAILADLDGVVRWGGDYTGRPDDMHFEIHASSSAVARVADRISTQEDDVSQADVIAALKSTEGKDAVGAAVHNQKLGKGDVTIAQVLQPLPAILAGLQASATADASRDAQLAATLAGMQTALSALAAAKGALSPEQVTALTAQVRQAAQVAGAEAVSALTAEVRSLREHLGDDE